MEKRKVLLAMALVGGAFVVLCGVGLVGLYFAAQSFSGEPEWEHTAARPSSAEEIHGVKIPQSAHDFYARQAGFQDAMYELLFELPPADVAHFLEVNGLKPGAQTSGSASSVLKLNRPPKAVELDGLINDETDAGFVQLYRNCELWEWPGRAFIYCTAFSS